MTGLSETSWSFIDDHSRYALSVTAHQAVTGGAVVASFDAAISAHDTPAGVLSDNGIVFTTRFAGGRGGRNKFQTRLLQLGITQKHSRPNHPTTCGKVERFQQTLNNWLDRQPPPATIEQLQTLLDQFVTTYNTTRPHHALAGHTPQAAYHARPKATPPAPTTPTTASAATPSTPAASSPCATPADYTTSASAEPTPIPAP